MAEAAPPGAPMILVDRPATVEVALVHWPRDAVRRDKLASTMRPRLLLVEPGTDPPPPADDLEDWVRLPSDERDVAARCEVLAQRAKASMRSTVVLDDARLCRGATTVALSPAEATLVRRLTQPIGSVVDRAELVALLWPGGAPSPKALDHSLYRLRRHLRPVGLDLLNVRGRGFLLATLSPIDTEAAE